MSKSDRITLSRKNKFLLEKIRGGERMNVMKERRLRGAIPTQREVAKILGVQESAVSKWERGITKPRADKLPILAKLYGCTIEELLGNEPVAVRAK